MTFLLPYLLQVSVTDFKIESTVTPREIIVFIIVVIVIVFAMIFSNKKTKNGAVSRSGGGGRGGIFASLALRRKARSIGLNREQVKMLEFVLKNDMVSDYNRSLTSPALLDRHFGRAYRVIERTSRSDNEVQYRHSVLFAARNKLESNVRGSLTSTRQLRDDSTVVITSGKERHSVSVITSTSAHLAVECPLNARGSRLELPKGSKISAVAFTKDNKGFSFESAIIGNSTVRGQDALLLGHSNNLKFISQRRFKRRQTVIACNLFLVYVEGSGKRQRMLVEKRALAGNIEDISFGGCSIKSRAPVQVGSRLKVEFKQGTNNVAALGQVVRTNRSGGANIIHVKFLKASRKSMNIINALVYEFTDD
uniref:PilZ domain-containing protein n=1 Tax=uncultured bacterium contig00030 TaxID=1181519 RepID=A0A806K063_9BACT|nr:hypothetical protein [uncultured bacterium contig00030]